MTTDAGYVANYDEEYATNLFIGATYELADGLSLGLGLASLDSDSSANRSAAMTFTGLDKPDGFSGKDYKLWL